ncbi:uncharacterized protein LOC106657852 [Trichogramma pretiosum]|uniref:uncharacterized protein LOC106657852 n=1 Tax=Trichogramma pretiosum TaxID=7493 RepID=UPI0006C93BDB|nr:uncharacterized protein LOC106657852 [Trichogramma pretiosum]
MSMLAAPRQKQKWTLNPQGKQWSKDSSKLGQRMLEKMGWSSGKGLGAKEQGATEHIRVKVKNDQVGLGHEKNKDDQWTVHQDSFNDLLANLQKEQGSTENSDQVLSGTSLEEKSKSSSKRVHYKKFTKGKDVNKYSAKDLANIFGKKELNEIQKESKAEENDSVYDPIGAKDTTAGIITIKGGDMSSYFQQKLNPMLNKINAQREDSESETEMRAGFGSTPKSKSKFYIESDSADVKKKPDIESCTGLDFTKNSESKSKNRKNKSMTTFDNPCLDVNILDVSAKSSESKSKSVKKKTLNYVFDNPCLDMDILSNSPKILDAKKDIVLAEKVTPRKRKHDVVQQNDILDVDFMNKQTPKKRKSDLAYENKGLDIDLQETNNNSNNEFEISAMELGKSLNKTPKKHKKINNELKSIGIDNPGLDLEYKENTILKSNGIENPALDLSFPDKPTPRKPKRNKKVTKTETFENPTLDMNSIEVNSTTTFEVIRPIAGLENNALDLLDESTGKRKVTFNEHVEYNTDTEKKKKKRKEKLDKYEVINNKLEKKKRTSEPIVFINAALSEECLNQEDRENKINEKKNKKNKKMKKISQLDTIEEAPEEDCDDVPTIVYEVKIESNNDVEFVGEYPNQNDPTIIRQVHIEEHDDIKFDEKDPTNNFQEKSCYKKVNKKNKSTIDKQSSLNEEFQKKSFEHEKKSKKNLKKIQKENPTFMFEGSNIYKIKGYGSSYLNNGYC